MKEPQEPDLKGPWMPHFHGLHLGVNKELQMCFKQGRTLANHVLQNEFSGYNMENNWSLDQYRHSELKKTES